MNVTLDQTGGFPYNKTMKRLIVIFAIFFLFFSCASTEISEDISPAELIQRAQEASDNNRYKTALRYHEILKERNPHIIDLVITAEYEIAFIHYKQGKYQQARKELTELLNYYTSPDQELLPQQFKRLAEIVLARIDEKEAQRQKSIFFRQKNKDT